MNFDLSCLFLKNFDGLSDINSDKLKNATSIDASCNYLNLSHFLSFLNLTSLSLQRNGITQLSLTSGKKEILHENLLSLNLSGNLLTCSSLDGLKYFKNLYEIDLSSNNLRELPSCISCLSKLEKVELCHNKLYSHHSMLVLSKCLLLKELCLSSNQFQNFSGNLSFPSLRNLYLSQNKIDNESELMMFIKNSPVLENMDVSGNPIERNDQKIDFKSLRNSLNEYFTGSKILSLRLDNRKRFASAVSIRRDNLLEYSGKREINSEIKKSSKERAKFVERKSVKNVVSNKFLDQSLNTYNSPFISRNINLEDKKTKIDFAKMEKTGKSKINSSIKSLRRLLNKSSYLSNNLIRENKRFQSSTESSNTTKEIKKNSDWMQELRCEDKTFIR